MIDVKDRIGGVVFGTAVGDALGYPVEFMGMDQILARYPSGVIEYTKFIDEGGKKVAPYSDDTQMMLAVFNGLLRSGLPASATSGIDWLQKTAEEVAEEFIAWSQSPENNRSPGKACMTGCRNLASGIPWQEAGAPGAKGCGTAMRSMAYGVWLWNAFGLAGHIAGIHSLMTHGSASAQAAAAAVACGVACGIKGDAPPEVLAELMVLFAKQFDLEAGNVIANGVYSAKIWNETGNPGFSPMAILDKYRGWTGEEAVAASVYCMLLSPDNYEEAVLRAVNSPGDSDSLGAITGALVGARVGLKGIPGRFIESIEKADQLRALVDRVVKHVPRE